MLFIFKTGTYFLIIHYNKLELTFKSYLLNAFLIFLAQLHRRKPETIS